MSVAAFVCSQKTDHGIDHAISCRALEVSQSWFYKWKNRIGAETPTAREQRRARLDADIKRLFAASGGTYGSPRIAQDLCEAGWRVSENTVARRMAELGLAGRAPKKSRPLTRQRKRPAAPDLVRRSRLLGYAMSAHLHRQLQLQERLAMGEAWTDSGFVFTQPDGTGGPALATCSRRGGAAALAAAAGGGEWIMMCAGWCNRARTEHATARRKF